MHGVSEMFEADCGDAKQVSVWRLLLADSNPIILHDLGVILGDEFPIVGAETTGAELLESLHVSDVLVSGFSLACGRNLLGLLRNIRVRHPDLAVLILLSPTDAGMVPRFHAAGARGVLSRRTTPQAFRQLVLDALQGPPIPTISSSPLSGLSASGSRNSTE